MEKVTPTTTKPISKRSERRSRQRRRSFERRQKEVESPVTSTSDEGDGISTLQQAEARNLEDIFNTRSGSNQASTGQGTMTTPSPPTSQRTMTSPVPGSTHVWAIVDGEKMQLSSQQQAISSKNKATFKKEDMSAMSALTNQTQIKQHVALVSANISDLVRHINHSN